MHRAVVNNRKRLNYRRDGVFLDKNGLPLVPPFDITPDTPVTVILPADSATTCIWARVLAVPADRGSGGGDGGGSDVFRRRAPFRRQPPFRLPRDRFPPIDLPAIRDIFDPAPKLVCEAYVNSAAHGPAPIGRRSAIPYVVSGPGIVEIAINGTGRVGGIEWINGHDRQQIDYEPWAIMNLPHDGGRRYLNIRNPMDHVDLRIARQSPKRLPLQETADAPTPASAPPSTQPRERARIDSLALKLAADLDRLITDPTPPLMQMLQEPVVGPGGQPLAKTPGEQSLAEMRRIERVHQLQLDPGTASLTGYKTLDEQWTDVEDRMVFYRISGFFRDFPPTPGVAPDTAGAVFDRALASVPFAERSLDRDGVFERFIALAGRIPNVGTRPRDRQDLEDQSDYLMVETVAVADRLAPLDQVEMPRITASAHVDWLPAPPPAAVREVETNLEGVRVSGLLAAGRRQPVSGPGSFTRINRKNAGGFHLPLTLGMRAEDGTTAPPSDPGTGFIRDRTVGPDNLRTFVAQQDRFGRWSEWTSRTAPPGARPKPPRPHLQGYYAQPAIADAATQGGTITAHVAVPDNDTLAPGSFPLDRVRVLAEDGRHGTVQTFEAAEAAKITFDDTSVPVAERRFVIVLTFAGPVLDPTEERRMILTARWIDTAGERSVRSEPHRLRMTDPRPPAQVPVPDVLLYSARPDVTGLAWVEHRWTRAAGQSKYGIYYTDENRMISHLEDNGQTVLLDQVAGAPDAAARAGVFRDNQALFPDSLYERLRDVEVSFNSGEVGFRHAVSGSLRILSAYKIAAEAESGAKPSLTDLDMILYGVPNADPPQRPTLKARPATPEPGENDLVAEITVSVVAGTTVARTWRLSRTQADSADPRKIPIVATGALSAPDPDTGIQAATYRDDGPVSIASAARLKPWVRYTWVAEVRGPPESGSTVPGLWSRPTDPVSLVLLPNTAPEPLRFVRFIGAAASGGRADLRIEVAHPQTLASGTLGHFRLRVERRLPGGETGVLSEANITDPPPMEVVATQASGEVVPIGSEFALTVIDPIGRASAPLRLPLV